MDLVTEQKLERRERILAAARDLIAQRGYEALTMRELAAHCRVSVPTLYNQFGGKQALLAAAVESHFAGLLAGTRARATVRGHRRLLAVTDACAEEMLRLPDYHRALLRAFMATRETVPLQASLADELTRELEAALDEMRGQRQLAAWASPGLLAHRITAACIGASASWLLGELDDAQLAAAMSYAAALMVLGCARGAARAPLESAARAAQQGLGSGRALATA